jgi:DNA (cytosine-5)-methyltransferase 1
MKTVPGTTERVSRFFKLAPNGICNTLRAGTDKSRGACTGPRPIHPSHNRCKSVRESQRLHSYPDWFRMHLTKWHGLSDVGNLVPPLLGRSLASQIIRALGVKPHKPVARIALGDEGLLRMSSKHAETYFRNLPSHAQKAAVS